MIPIQWSERTKIPNLPELVQNYRECGGAIIEYGRVWSVVYFSSSSLVFEWVPPTSSRRIAGIKHALFCLFFGWWSPAGLFWTLPAVINNFLGGVDVTQVLVNPPPLPGQSYDPAAIQELLANRRRQAIIGLFSLALVLGVIISFIVRDCSGRHPRSPIGYAWMLERNGGDHTAPLEDTTQANALCAQWANNWHSSLAFFTSELDSPDARHVKTSMLCLTHLASAVELSQLSEASRITGDC